MSSITGPGSPLSGYRWSDSVVEDVLQEHGLVDREALLAKATAFDENGNQYLSRTELVAAAKALAEEIPAGYRWNVGVLDAVLESYGLSDAKALVKAAIVFDNGNGYLNRTELTAAADQLSGSAQPGAGYKWSPSVLADVMTRSGVADEATLLAEAIKQDDGNRYLKRSELEAAAKLITGMAPELGIISDLDKTVIPPHSGDLPGAAYPGVAQLFCELDLGGGGKTGDTHYVTARGPDRVTEIPAWLEEHGIPVGSIDTGTSSMPWIAQPEKVADIERLLDAYPGQRFFLFGDTSHRDPEVYREVMDAHPDRILGVFIHKVNNVSSDRVEGMNLVENYAQAAATLYQMGVLDEAAARRVMVAAQLQGLDITDADIETLIAGHRPA